MHACSRTLRVGLMYYLVMSLDLWGIRPSLCRDCGLGESGCAAFSEPVPWAFAEPRASRVPSSDEEVVEEPQSRRTRMSLGTKGLKVNLFPGLSPSALKVPSDHSKHAQPSGQVATLHAVFLLSIHQLIPLSPSPIPPLILISIEGSRRSLCALLGPVLCA